MELFMSFGIPGEVWKRFVNGDDACFGILFKQSYSSLYGYGLKICGDPGVVEDAIQNLFASVWERRDELSHITSPHVYLFVSLRRSVLKAKKKKDQEKGITSEEQYEYQIEFGVEEIIMKKEAREEQKEKLHEALNQLSNQQKEVLYLHYYNGMSYGEIEEVLSISRQSVRNHMYRAMETLRTVLDLDVMKLVIALMLSFLFLV
jgi:RNA polymerase sigma factor (sigma-70 family)